MGIFKKKGDKKLCNKRCVIAIEIIVAVLLFLTLLGLKWLITNIDEDANIVKLDNQVINNVSFVDFKVEYTDKQGDITVSAINYTNEEIEIPNLKIKLYSSDNSLISQIEVANPIALQTNQEQLITSTISTTSRVASVEYVIE